MKKKQQPTREQADQRREEIHKLRGEGLTVRAIAEKLGVSKGNVHYYLYSGKQNYTNGETIQNGHHSKDLIIGICYAETERFVGVLSERFSVPAKVLRQRLSELLGHSPLR